MNEVRNLTTMPLQRMSLQHETITETVVLQSSRLRAADDLTSSDILALASGSITALRIREFYSKDLAVALAHRLIHSTRLSSYRNAPIGRIGRALYEAAHDQDRLHEYFLDAHTLIVEDRATFAPFLSPIDAFRLTLAESWMAGVGLERVGGRLCYVGLTRVFEPGSEALPHQDILRWDVPESRRAFTLKTQFGANIYLNLPPAGGELELWGRQYADAEYESLKLAGTYGLDRRMIEPPVLTIRPEIGDLILFRSNELHAVRPVAGGPRVTVSCFIGYRGKRKALSMWS